MYRYILFFLFLSLSCTCKAQFYKPIVEWFDYSLNRFDSTYIERENRQITVKLKNNHMLDNYTFRLPEKYKFRMESDLSSEMALNVGYGILSIGYSQGIQNLFSNSSRSTRNLSIAINSNRISLDFSSIMNNDRRKITAYKDYEDISIPFSGIKMKMFELNALYYLNYKRYLNAADNVFHKRQLHNAGSLITGISLSGHDITFDFSEVAEKFELPEYLSNNLKYTDLRINLGYGYNKVFSKKWLLEMYIIPAAGIKFCNTGRNQLALNNKIKLSLVYNASRFFGSLVLLHNSYWYVTKQYALDNSIEKFNLCVGMKIFDPRNRKK